MCPKMVRRGEKCELNTRQNGRGLPKIYLLRKTEYINPVLFVRKKI
jgi:hypothetical protein